MRRALVAAVVVGVVTVVGAGPALACGGLIGRNGAVNLERTTTLAAYKDGVEHYVTAFEFNGAGGEFGSIVPLPGVPTKVEKGGDWTLQRLRREVDPPAEALAREPARPQSVALPPAPRVLLENTHRRARHHRARGRRHGGGRLGPRARLPAAARLARGARLLRQAQPDLHGRRASTASAPQRGAQPSATARPSTSRSRPRTRGCRCASSPSASSPTPSCRPTSSCSPSASPRCCPRATTPGFDLSRSRGGVGVAADRPAHRQGHGVGARRRCG